jgi:hypothetical protein
MPSSDSEAPGAPSASFEEELRHIEEEQGEAVDLEAKQRELDEMKRRAHALESQLETARAGQRRRAAASVLPLVQPREPCTAPWHAMRGDGRVRSCARCKQRVYDLGALPPDDARALLTQHEGKLPRELHARVDGTVTAASCDAARRRMPAAVLAAGAAAGIALCAGAAVFGWYLRGDPPPAMQVSLSEAQLGNLIAALRTPPPAPVREARRERAHSHCRGFGLRMPDDDLGLLLFFAEPLGGGCDDEDDDW